MLAPNYLSELRRDFLASVGITYAVFRIAKSRLRAYLSKLRRDSIGADFQSVRKLTNYVCAKPLESRLSHISKGS